jgi:hypothetical protein
MKFTKFATKEEVKEWESEALKPLIKENDERMVRAYVDCMDDSIVCGISDNLCKERMFNIRQQAKAYVEQVENGFLTIEQERVYLYDLDDNLVSDKIVLGQYGYCWLIENQDGVKFVGCVKRQSTLNKKGYKAKRWRVTFKAVWNGGTTNYKRFTRPMYSYDFIERTLTEIDFTPLYNTTDSWEELVFEKANR